MIAALEADLEAKKALIAKMQTQLMQAGAPLPPEMNMLLQDFAKTSDMIDFDASTGMLKFKSDLLFSPGSDEVAANAAESIKALAGIMNSAKANSLIWSSWATPTMCLLKRPRPCRNTRPTGICQPTVPSASNRCSTPMGLLRNAWPSKAMANISRFNPTSPTRAARSNRRVEIFIIPGSS